MKALMDKYKLLTGIYLKVYRKYPIGLFLKLIYLPVQMLMYIFLWLNISKSNVIDIKYLITYYLLTSLLLYAYPYTHIANNIENDVIEGGISNYLVRPISYINPILCQFTAWICLYSIIFIPAIIFVYFFRGFTFIQIGLFLLSAVIGLSVEFMLWYNVGLISFFIERIRGVMTTVIALRMFVSGSLIPLSFFPKSIRNLTYLFPFRFYIYVPVNSLLGEMDHNEILANLIIGVVWLILFIFLSKLLWNKGIKKMQVNMS
jgi:ABC-2 type transport system permease protein